MRNFKELRENSFYTTQAEKIKFESNDKLVMNAFIFGFVGMVGLLDSAKDNTRVKAYFRSDQKLRPTEINDQNQDSSLIIKIMLDKGFFKKSTTPNEITRFLVKAKAGQIDTVDPEIIRGWIRDVKDDKMKNLSAVVRREVNDFLNGGSLATLTDQLKANAKVTRWKESEFGVTSKSIRIDPAKKKVVAAQPAISTTANDTRTPTKTVALDAPAKDDKPQAKTVPAQKPVAKQLPSIEELFVAIRDGKDITSLYKKPDSRLNTSVAIRFYNEIQSITTDQGKRFVDYLQNNSFSNQEFRKTIFPRRYGSVSTPNTDKMNKALECNIDLILDKLTKAESESFALAISNYFKDWVLGRPQDWEADSKNPDKLRLANSIASNHGGYQPFNLYISYLTRGKEKTLELMSQSYNYRSQLEKIGDGYVYYTEPKDTMGPSTPLSQHVLDFMEFLGAKKESPLLKTISEYLKTGIFTQKISNLSDKDQKDFIKAVLETGSKYPASAAILKNSKTAKLPWQISLLVDIVSKVKTEDFYTNSAGINLDKLDDYPKQIINSIAEKDHSELKNTILPDIIKVAEYTGNQGLKDKTAKKYFEEVFSKIASESKNAYRYGSWSDPTDESPKTPELPLRDFMNENYKDLQNKIDDAYITKCILLEKSLSYPANTFSNMSDANKRKVISYLSVKDVFDRQKAFNSFREITDDTLLQKLDPKLFIESGGSIANYHRKFSSDDVKKEVFDKILSDPELKEKAKEEVRSTNRAYSDSFELILTLSESDKITEKEFTELTNTIFDKVKDGDLPDFASRYSVAINKKEKMNKKDSIFFEKSILLVDEKVGKLKLEYRNLMSDAQPAFVSYTQSDKKGAAALYESMSKSMKKRMAAAYLSNGEFALNAGQQLVSDDNPIKPFEKLNEKRIREILKYNNVVSEETKISDKYTKSLDALDEYIKFEDVNKLKKMEDLKVNEVKRSPKELSQMSADLHRNKRNNKHGDVSMVIKREFDVAIPLQVESQKEWIEKNPTQEIINPMYHGTGSIAASMILRYGFRVIKSGDSSVVGRMLGDGVYGAIHIDKSQQYVGDSGYGRTPGLRGYIFEMNAALGEEGKDYKAAGLGRRDNIRSPEWCVFTPNSQFKIFKAYEIELVRGSTMARILSENPPVRNESKMSTFKKYLNETTVPAEEYPNYTSYTFVNGLIPISETDYVDFEEFKPKENVTLEPSAYGPSVIVKGTNENNDYLFTSPMDFYHNHPDLFQTYLSQISG